MDYITQVSFRSLHVDVYSYHPKMHENQYA